MSRSSGFTGVIVVGSFVAALVLSGCPIFGKEITIMLPGDVPLVVVNVPTGSFLMGKNPGDPDSQNNEAPQHEVNIITPIFYMGKYEVTQEQWLALMGSWPGPAVPSSPYGLGDKHPAYLVSWDDAQDFMTALNNHIASTGQGPYSVRLPSESEWEYSCRAETTTRFYFGNSLECGGECQDCAAGTLSGNRRDYMWYCGNNPLPGESGYGTKQVGMKSPNAFGLYDMCGNVFEWCEDDWHDNYLGAPTDGSAWIESPRSAARVIRGGDWGNNAEFCRSPSRVDRHYYVQAPSAGFRVALVIVLQ